MAQLIKLQDYISRYELDTYRYPSQFVRLKKQQWAKWKESWDQGELLFQEEPEEAEDISEKTSLMSRFGGLFKKREKEEAEWQELEILATPSEEDSEMNLNFTELPSTEEELKHLFLDQLFHFQLRWASSTIMEKSYVDKSYTSDERLMYFLKRFPDNIFLMYFPVFKFKNAPMEMDILLLTPTEIWCLTFMEEEDEAAYIGSQERFWLKKSGNRASKVLNPLISLNRMESVISTLMKHLEVDLPIKKGIISRNGYIDYGMAPHNLNLIDKRAHAEWFGKMRASHSPIKNVQLKLAKGLLDFCQSTSFKRLGWQSDDNHPLREDEEEI
ncbi:NERD domain-containing protein [Rossellomorea vietnamensis]|uniref:NERD domain-containing protein n=1 Tax=Rossellomorea vietnamensis TaxID=218284 RepID=A0A5D4KL37_9BACI|nr:NERD domain-containing protein [Rossellomorea vietnamensis]TYR77023.1 NERD domain-containing protein [Rossellomorea vietnamensis]